MAKKDRNRIKMYVVSEKKLKLSIESVFLLILIFFD